MNHALDSISNPELRQYAQYAYSRAQEGDTYDLRILASLKRYPVAIEEFVTGPEYLGMDSIYPKVMEAMVELCNPEIDGLSHGMRLGSFYNEAVLTGAIGTGKSTIGLIVTAYWVYVLSCLKNPQRIFGIDESSEIVFIFQSINASLAKSVDYNRFKAMVGKSTYFQQHFPFNKDIQSELQFPHRIIVKPVSGLESGTIGHNIFGGCFPSQQEFLMADGSISSMKKSIGKPISVLTRSMSGETVASPATTVLCTGEKRLVQLHFENGDSMICTLEQKFKGVDNEWITAEQAEGRNFRFTGMQTMREQGHLSDSASQSISRNVGERVQDNVSGRTVNRAENDRDSAKGKQRGRSRNCRVSGLWAIITHDLCQASSYARCISRTVQRALSRHAFKNPDGSQDSISKSTKACVATAQGACIQSKPAKRGSQGPSSCVGSNSSEVHGPGREAQTRQENSKRVARPRSMGEGGTTVGFKAKDIYLRIVTWACRYAVKARDSFGLLVRRTWHAVEVRRCNVSIYSQGVGAGVHAGFLGEGTWAPCGGENQLYDEQRGGRVFQQDESNGRLLIRDRRGGPRQAQDRQRNAVAEKECKGKRYSDIRSATEGVSSVRCIRVESYSALPQRVYDVENAGPTHSFFVKTSSGFLEGKNCLDEMNFMEVITRSKKSMDGDYDQAISLYNSISRRRKSRFMKQGRLPGILCLISSKRYPGQFTDQKMEDARRESGSIGQSSIYVYDKTTWDIKPASDFCGDRFAVFAGDETRKPRILLEGEKVTENDTELVVQVPVEYRSEFETDIMKALRDIAGMSTMTIHPFIMDVDAVSACFDKRESILSHDTVDFSIDRLQIVGKNITDPHHPRFAHIDLALTGDSAGLVIGHVPRFMVINSGEEANELMPVIAIDCSLEIVPPKGGEIAINRIRDILYALRDKCGVDLRWVTFDSFQSADSIQSLRQRGFTTGNQSMDRTPVPYEFTKQALYDGRIEAPGHPKLLNELASLERDARTGKIDHRPNGGSKDVSDALAGVVYGLTRQKWVWLNHGIPPMNIPKSLIEQLKAGSKGGA